MRGMKTIALTEASRIKHLHIELPGALVNIYVGLRTTGGGRPMTVVNVSADGNRYAGDPAWWVDGKPGNDGVSVRIIREEQ